MKQQIKALFFFGIIYLSIILTGKSENLLNVHTVITAVGPGPYAHSSDNNTLGFDFIVGANPVLVSDLGLFDLNGDGLANSHAIGLWDMNGSLLASVTLAAGTGAPLSNQFRYAPLANPLTLLAGTKYVLGAEYQGSSDADYLIVNFPSDQATYDPAIIGNDVRYFAGAGFTFPVLDPYRGSEVGPNAIFTVVPEPVTPILLIAFSFCLSISRKTRR